MATVKKAPNIKLIIIGSANAGKTSLLRQFVYHTFDAKGTSTTLGADFCLATVPLPQNDGTTANHVRISIWDTAGMENFSAIAPSFFRGSDGAILVYDITNKASFEHCRTWRDLFLQHAGAVPVLLVGNKVDLADKRQVSTDDGKRMMKDSGGALCGAVELTAGDSVAVEGAFVQITKAMLAHGEAKSKGNADMMSQSDIRRVRMGSVPPSQNEPPKKECAC